jgi:hypothetical protein
MRRILTIAAMMFITTTSASACAGKILGSTAQNTLHYSPFDALDAKQQITIKIHNKGADRCSYQLSIPDRYFPTEFTPNIRFAITATGNDGRSGFAAVTPTLQPGEFFSLPLTLVVYRGQSALAGALTKRIGFALSQAGHRPVIDEAELLLVCNVKQIFEVNLAGSGTRTSLQLSGLKSNSSKSVVMQTRATQQHRLIVQATTPYLAREGGPITEVSKIPFALSIDGREYTLQEGSVLNIHSPPGEANRLITVKLGDAANKLAGIYRATITIRIASDL